MSTEVITLTKSAATYGSALAAEVQSEKVPVADYIATTADYMRTAERSGNVVALRFAFAADEARWANSTMTRMAEACGVSQQRIAQYVALGRALLQFGKAHGVDPVDVPWSDRQERQLRAGTGGSVDTIAKRRKDVIAKSAAAAKAAGIDNPTPAIMAEALRAVAPSTARPTATAAPVAPDVAAAKETQAAQDASETGIEDAAWGAVVSLASLAEDDIRAWSVAVAGIVPDGGAEIIERAQAFLGSLVDALDARRANDARRETAANAAKPSKPAAA